MEVCPSPPYLFQGGKKGRGGHTSKGDNDIGLSVYLFFYVAEDGKGREKRATERKRGGGIQIGSLPQRCERGRRKREGKRL